MKKQIFILVMAIFAISFNTAFGQVIPRTITCLTEDALNPIAGKSYTYTISVPSPPTGTRSVLWYVTQDINFITGGSLTAPASRAAVDGNLLAAADVKYNSITPGLLTMNLTWKSIAYNPANPIFVVVNVSNDDGTCAPNNLMVYEIKPKNTFTLDIANIQAGNTLVAGYGANIFECLPNIVSAKYDAVAKKVIYDYGVNTLLYEVNAANWNGQWRPRIQITGIDPSETVKVEWSKDRTFASGITLMSGSTVGTGSTATDYTSSSNVTTTAAGNRVGTGGESIFFRVTLDHTVSPLMYVGLTDELVKLAVDGILYSETVTGNNLWTVSGLGDVHWNNGILQDPCPDPVVDGFTNDIAYQTIKARPGITAVTPTLFITPVPAP